jgi:hypothetical protein
MKEGLESRKSQKRMRKKRRHVRATRRRVRKRRHRFRKERATECGEKQREARKEGAKNLCGHDWKGKRGNGC